MRYMSHERIPKHSQIVLSRMRYGGEVHNARHTNKDETYLIVISV